MSGIGNHTFVFGTKCFQGVLDLVLFFESDNVCYVVFMEKERLRHEG